MLNDGGKFIVYGSWEIQVVKLVKNFTGRAGKLFHPV
jgi:hypothetical protein